MNEKIKQTSKKYIVIPVFAIGLMAVLVLANVQSVSASNSSRKKGDFAQVLAEKFNLDQEEVEQTLQEFHHDKYGENEQRRRDHFEDRLEQAVIEGKLTEAQSYAILEKFEEMHNRLEELYDQDLSEDEMHELKADIHEEMQAWSEDQGVDFEMFLRTGQKMFNGHQRMMH